MKELPPFLAVISKGFSVDDIIRKAKEDIFFDSANKCL
jgi:hypothetical protein